MRTECFDGLLFFSTCPYASLYLIGRAQTARSLIYHLRANI